MVQNFDINIVKELNLPIADLALLFFEPGRSAVLKTLLLKMQLLQMEKILQILNISKKLAEDYNITIEPIPTKIAVPFLEKMSIENDENMYETWAKLLTNVVEGYNPIQNQYIEILSKIGFQESNILNSIYNEQKTLAGIGMFKICEKTLANCKMDKHLALIIHNSNSEQKRIELEEPISLTKLPYPYILKGESEIFAKKFHHELDVSDRNANYEFCVTPDYFSKSESIYLSLNLLKQLDLIDYHFDIIFEGSNENGYRYTPQWGVVLSEFGYKLVDTLQKYN